MKIEVVGGGDGTREGRVAGGALVNHDEAIRLREWEGFEYEGVGNGEDGGIGSDAEGEGEDREQGEAGIPAETSQGGANFR